jgi:hypothetical protein
MLFEFVEKALKLVAGNSLRVSSKERAHEGEYDTLRVINDSGADLEIRSVHLVRKDGPAIARDVFSGGKKVSLPITIRNKSSIDLQPQLDRNTYMLERGYVVTIFNGSGFFANINLPRQTATKCNIKTLLSEVTRGKSSAV